MVKTKLYFLIFLASLSQILNAQTCILTLKIEGLKNTDGEIQIGIYNNKEAFPLADKQFRVVIIQAAGFGGTSEIKDLPAGDYAIAILHDENGDSKCNTNFLGIPKEGYGFSKNFRPMFSGPKFDDCKISLTEDTIISINLIY